MTDGFLTIAEVARLIEQRRLSPVELVQGLLERIAAIDPQLDSFVTVTAERAMAQARKAEDEIAAGRYRGPMHGIPFGLKDIYDTAGLRTAGQSRTAMDRTPERDAESVRRLYAAGAVLLGKLTTHEFAYGGPSFDLPWPPARNPWDRERFTGGSSSGSGAAVAAGLTLLAMGSDTGGSIRSPASLCGVAGLKPTYGRISKHGVIPNTFSFDTCGPMAWTAEDCALALQALAGFDPSDPSSIDHPTPDYRAALTGSVKGLRIGLLRHFWEEDLPANAEVVRALDEAVAVFRDLGAVVEDARIRPLQDYYDVKITIAGTELVSAHRTALVERPFDLGADFVARLLPACLFMGADYMGAVRRRRLYAREMESTFARHDLLLAPSTYGPAPPLQPNRTVAFWQNPSVTVPFNVTGGPALSFCMGFSESGLPLGLQLAGRPFDEATVLRAAHAFERATPWRARRPELAPAPRPRDPVPEPYVPRPDLDAKTRAMVDMLIARQGLENLSETHRAALYEGAPYILAMASRVRADLAWADEPAHVYIFPHGA